MIKVVEPSPIPVRGAYIWPLSVAAYHALGEAGLIPKNAELLGGIVYQKMPKAPLHSFLALRLLRLLQKILPEGFLLRGEQPITCNDSEPEPDVSIVRGAESDYLSNHPQTAEFVIEVCVTSHDYDRSKLAAYASAGVKEVWLVLGPEKQIEVHRQPQGGRFVEHFVQGPGGTISCAALPEFSMELESLFSL